MKVPVDFRPIAVDGWRAVFLVEPSGLDVMPLAGWLIQEEEEHWDALGDPLPREREIVPAIWGGDGALDDASSDEQFVMVIGPGEPVPYDREPAARSQYEVIRKMRDERHAMKAH